jgi:hypothetical protein
MKNIQFLRTTKLPGNILSNKKLPRNRELWFSKFSRLIQLLSILVERVVWYLFDVPPRWPCEGEVWLGGRRLGRTGGLDLKGLTMAAWWRLRESLEPMAYCRMVVLCSLISCPARITAILVESSTYKPLFPCFLDGFVATCFKRRLGSDPCDVADDMFGRFHKNKYN